MSVGGQISIMWPFMILYSY